MAGFWGSKSLWSSCNQHSRCHRSAGSGSLGSGLGGRAWLEGGPELQGLGSGHDLGLRQGSLDRGLGSEMDLRTPD